MNLIRLLSRRSVIVGIASLLATAMCVSGQQEEGFERYQFEGSLGNSRIGLTLVLDGGKITSGHYFYQKFLQDIPITGSIQGSEISLTEPEGGTFLLRFVGNGSEGNQPLGWDNSIGMKGTWTRGDRSRSYAVSLHLTTILNGADGRRRYEYVTRESDGAFEKRVQSFWRAVLERDKDTAVRFISYPLRVNLPNRTHKKLRTSTEVLAAWDKLFTPAMIAKLQQDLPHDMFV